LTDLAQRCAEETSHFFGGQAHDPRYCHELLYRAVVLGEQAAWEAVFAQYRPLVTAWVLRHPGFRQTGEEGAYFVNRAFEKLWAALTVETFGRFESLAAILRYLQMCVHSAVVDHLRQAEHAWERAAASPPSAEEPKQEPSGYDPQLDRLERAEFWAVIEGKLRDDKERQVIYASYVIGLKPQEICEVFHKLFGSPDEVYLAKQNVLARLRRDPDLRHSLGLGD
jgi:DNA-directed RNA polymerase specialized sigma24 family protein